MGPEKNTSSVYLFPSIKVLGIALTGVAQLVGNYPAKERIAGSIPSQGTCLGVGSIPRQGVFKKQPINVSVSHQCFSPSLSPSFPFSLNINKNIF